MARGTRNLIGLLLVAGLVLAGFGAAEAQGILNTKHNLSSVDGTGNARDGNSIYTTNGTTEVCVFCHTPHGADTAVKAPLWNRTVAATAGYTMYNSTSLDSTPDKNNMGVSLACLSCHDGTIAFDVLRNRPGSGGFSDSPTSAGWAWNASYNTMAAKNAVTYLGQNLSNDHPIAMVYTDAFSPSSLSGTNDHATGFYSSTTNASKVYVARTWGAAEVRLPLYPDSGTTSPRVQCASCHDPHRSDTATFLRVSNTSSQLCRTCHKKDG